MDKTLDFSLDAIISWLKELKEKCRFKWLVLKDQAFHTVVLYQNSIQVSDDFRTKRKDEYLSYTFDITILKLYTIQGIYYRISVPNFSSCSKNLYECIWDVAKFLDKGSPAYFRLVDELTVRDIWRKM